MVITAGDRVTICESEQLGVPRGVAFRAATSQCALLLCGATGTGKGFLAQWLHSHSDRSDRPFVAVNCGALPEGLIDSHLFGHARGSFSGATHDHQGLVRAAEGGTLLLDEVSELPMTAQLRLLRLLEEREVQPVGFSRPVAVDVRIIAATNGNLQKAVESGRFREDLFFRLDVVRLQLAPLCQRRSDIGILIGLFNRQFATLYRHRQLSFCHDAMECMLEHAWPGNVRQLRSVVERLHVLLGSGAAVGEADLRQHGQLQSGPARPSGAAALVSMRLEAIHQTLSACRGNVSQAAAEMGVHRSTLYRWLSAQPIPA